MISELEFFSSIADLEKKFAFRLSLSAKLRQIFSDELCTGISDFLRIFYIPSSFQVFSTTPNDLPSALKLAFAMTLLGNL